MMYDKTNRLNDDDDNDLWDDEMELTTDTNHTEDSEWDESNIDKPEADYGYGYGSDQDDYYSDPEPEVQSSPKSNRKRFLGKRDDDDENDYYDSDAEPEPEPIKKPKLPKLDPEDPDYWIEEESGLSSILPKPEKKWKWWLAGVLTLSMLIVGAWIWFFMPYVDSAVKYGYIRDMERRGSLIKTFEGTMIPYKELGDPNPMNFEILPFSVESDSLAAIMKRMMLDCIPVRVEYEVYHTSIPWKGESRLIVIKADTADTKKIVPPEFR